MILRVLSGRAPVEVVDELRRRSDRLFTGEVQPPGLIVATFGRQHEDRDERFVCVTQWRDLASLYDWIGCIDLLCSPRLLAGLEPRVSEIAVQHYEVAASTTNEPADVSPDLGAAGDLPGTWRREPVAPVGAFRLGAAD